MKTPSYLRGLNAYPENYAQFITRIPGVETSTDRAATLERLQPEHDRILREGGIDPVDLRRAQQVHGNKVALVGDIGCSYPVEGVDGLLCSGVADCCLGIYVADCAAIWIYDTVTGSRALLHSGKAGTENNIVASAMQGMRSMLKVKPSDCIAVISPCIRPPHYEMDISGTIVSQLEACGILPANITDCGLDTAADLETFYSYRMEQGNTGRMLALFGRNPH